MTVNIQGVVEITQAEIKEYLRYEPDTGNFYWVKNTNSRGPSKVGQLAGCTNAYGYWQIGLFGLRLYGHVLAWLYVYGRVPRYIDHKDRNPTNNRIENLRECTHSQNHGNYKRRKNGIELHGRKYRVRIVKDGVRHEFGSYSSLQEADVVADAAYDKLFGEFAFACSN
jgi:hypothetical protein